jgi:hypothetical protein
MSYDDWKTTEPDYDVDEDLEIDEDPDEDGETGCVLGERCLAADPWHTSADCFDAAMAEAFYGDGPNGCVCGFNGDCNCRFAP